MHEKIQEIAEIFKLSHTSLQVDNLLIYAEEVLFYNKLHNLTGKTNLKDFILGPLFDAMTLLGIFKAEKTLVDIGSGGGLPAIPLCIFYPQIRVTLAEPRTKRAAFLKHLVDKLCLNAEVLCTQDRELPSEKWHCASSQAVFPASKWLKRGRRLIKPGGSVYVLSSEPVVIKNTPSNMEIISSVEYKRPYDSKSKYATRVYYCEKEETNKCSVKP